MFGAVFALLLLILICAQGPSTGYEKMFFYKNDSNDVQHTMLPSYDNLASTVQTAEKI